MVERNSPLRSPLQLSSLSDFSVMLDFGDLSPCGREQELKVLHDAFRDAINYKMLRVVEVKGKSGTGKTTLVETLRDSCGFFVSGKFHEGREMPYAGLAYALMHLCDLISQSCQAERVSAELKEVLQSDVEILCNVVPNIEQLVGKTDEQMGDKIYIKDWGFERLKTLVRDFLRVAASPEHPVVIFIDDLQWADDACLRLLSFLCRDKEIKGLLFVGSYREDEVEDCPLLHKLMREVREDTGALSTIPLCNLDLAAVNDIILQLTSLRSGDSTKELAEIVHNKTGGNPFHVIQFLHVLQERKLLKYNLVKLVWEFDVKRIQTETNISANIADLVKHNLKRLSQESREVLQVAAFYCSHFDVDTIGELIQVTRGKELTLSAEERSVFNERLTKVIEDACKLGLLDKCLATGKYKFAHDRIQQASYSMVPAEGSLRCEMHLKMGKYLKEKSETEPKKSIFFQAADQFSRCTGLIQDPQEKIELAKLDLTVAEIAIRKSAFVPAAEYLKSGTELLSDQDWTTNYELKLRIHCLLGRMAYCTGDFKSCKMAATRVLENGRSLPDKMQAYFTLIECYASEGHLKDALSVGSEILGKLGEPFPRKPNKMHVLVDLFRTKRLLQGKSEEELFRWKVETQEDVVFAMKLMVRLIGAAWLAVEPALLALLCLRLVRLSMLRGLTEYSACGFACYGFVLATLGKRGEGYRFGKFAERLLQLLPSPESETRCLVIIHIFLNHLRKPYHESLEPLLYGYGRGMASGDIESATMCILAYSSMYMFCGLNLEPLELDMRKFGTQIKEYGQAAVYNVYCLYWQCVLNLLGHSENATKLTGEVMDEDDTMTEAIATDQVVTIQGIWWVKMMLCVFFGDLEEAAKLASKLSARRKSVDKTTHSIYQKYFFMGLAVLARARRKPHPVYKVRANKVIRKFEGWVQEGVVNCHHMLLLLKAEKASLKRGSDGSDEAGKHYEAAIRSASRSGFLHHAALSHELFGMFLGRQGEQVGFELHTSLACDLYGEWGAAAKVKRMVKLHSFLNQTACDSKSVSSGSASGGGSFRGRSGRSLRGRARFTSVSSDTHKGKSLRTNGVWAGGSTDELSEIPARQHAVAAPTASSQ